MNAEPAPICPRCGQLDAVRKVSSIVKEGVSVGEYEAYHPVSNYIEGKLVSTTELAQKLKPPDKPSVKGATLTCLGVSLGGLALGILGMILSVLAMLIAGLLTNNTIIASIAGILAFVLFLYRVVRIENKELEEVKQATPIWEKAMQRWSSVFYCYRCDGVFVPGENRFIPIEQMRSFLYE